MKKKIIYLLILLIIVTGCKNKSESISLMDYGKFKNITEDNISKIEIIKYTEAGDNRTLVEDGSVKTIYNNLKQKKIGSKTNMACEDNTTIYVFYLTDDSKISVEIECDWVVIGKERYLIK